MSSSNIIIKLYIEELARKYGTIQDEIGITDTTEEPVQDVTAKIIGDFGRWQLKTSILMSLLKLSNAWYQLNIIFMAPPQEFYCVKPELFAKYTDEQWRNICSPKIEENPCLIFDPDMLIYAQNDAERISIPLIVCPKFVYDTSVFNKTMTSEWDLVCDKRWMIHITQCVMMTGVLLGGVIFGILADKYGRKSSLMAAIVIQSVASFLACIIPSYSWFLPNWFMLALASGGITTISFVICMEAVGGKWRTIIPVLYQLPFGLGNTVMSLLAYWLRDWRKLEFGLATLSSLYIFYWCLITESPRWLIATGQTEKAAETLTKIGNENKRYWSSTDIKSLLPEPQRKKNIPGFLAFMRSKNMRLKTILLSIDWFCTGLAFYTFSQYLGEVGGNIFLTLAVTGIISTPGPIICVFVITRVGRKTTVSIFQLMTALCFVTILLLPRNTFTDDWPRLLFAGIGFAGMAAFVPTLYLYSGELFPTLGRNVGVGGVTTFARFGSMIAPMIVGLDSVRQDLPLMILAAISFAQILLLVPLPETKDTLLPDTLEQAELVFKQPSNNDQEQSNWHRIKHGFS